VTLKYAMMAAGTPAQQAAAITGITTALSVSTAAGAPAGNSQATAIPIPSDFVALTGTSVGAGTGYLLPKGIDAATGGTVQVGDLFEVHNQGGNAVLVYPNTAAGKVQGAGAGVGFSVANNKVAFFTYLGNDTWSAVLSS
jgi:hypothetical protein